MNRVLYILILLAAVVLVAGQGSYAQGPPAYFGHILPAEPSPIYPLYRGPTYAYNIAPGVFFVEPFIPAGFVYSRPGAGFPAPWSYVNYATNVYWGPRGFVRGGFTVGGYFGRLP